MATTLAEVLHHFGPEYLSHHLLSSAQARAWRAIVACRTPALGGVRLRCEGCQREHWRWHSCRNRHCPQCQSRQRDAWRAARLGELLTVPYCHLVFTLPHELNPLAATHARWVYDALMHEAAATLTEFAANPRWLGGVPAFTLVLHTWTQDLRCHIHVHALMACGALKLSTTPDSSAPSWVRPTRSERFLFPVHALSRVFRGKFMQALHRAEAGGDLPRDPADASARRARTQALRRHDWVVYAKTPLAGPAAVLDYLSRYTHRTAIGHERLVGIAGDAVRLRVRTDEHGGKRTISMPGEQFIARLLQHVLPGGFKRIRHYGLLAPCAKTERLAQARQLLAMPTANRQAQEDARAFMKRVAGIEINTCAHCKGTWRVVEQRGADVLRLRGLLARPDIACRGPP
ncbi:MAG: IS91 family transposase [Roseateles sp.]|uniref:IS91 family transposase n=1 Tax=Roseateles sp. TaxID=1971397 RepID=UPI004035D255